MNIIARNERVSPILRLPAELRLQIYGYVIGSRIIYVRMKWSGICNPSGFAYTCLDDTQVLLESHESDILSHAVRFGSDFHSLNSTCRQIQKETAPLLFTAYIWAFETAFTLDQWVSMQTQIPKRFKGAIKTVAVPTPGPYRSSERILRDLQEVLLIGTFNPVKVGLDEDQNSSGLSRAMISLRKDRVSNTWVRNEEGAHYAKECVK